MLNRQTLLLKPMQTHVSGYARIQTENGRTAVQLHARGLENGRVRLFGCMEAHTVRELAEAGVNANGEASMQAETAGGLRGLMVIAMPPRPLLIGVMETREQGALLEVKNAALALCERLSRRTENPAAVTSVPSAGKGTPPETLPREIFLPAIDPAPYVAAASRERREADAARPSRPEGPTVDRLPALRWPESFASLRTYFETRRPTGLFALPGWQFVNAADGLWLGMQAVNGHVRRVAYAYAARIPSGLEGKTRPCRAADGKTYRLLIQNV